MNEEFPIDPPEKGDESIEDLGREYSSEEKQEMLAGMEAQSQEWEGHLVELQAKLGEFEKNPTANALDIMNTSVDIASAKEEIRRLREYIDAAQDQALYTKPRNP